MSGMPLLIVGLALWVLPHLFKRFAPTARARLGDPGKGLVALCIVAAIALMAYGYAHAPYEPLYDPLPGIGHLNNLLMVFAVVIFGAGMSKGVLWTRIRHPQLWGVTIWSVAHLIVNGDVASVWLFGTLGVWAVLEMALLNRAGPWIRPASGGWRRDAGLVAVAAVAYAVIAAIHIWAGHNPFLGTYA